MAAPNTARHISHPVAGGRGTARDAAIGAGFEHTDQSLIWQIGLMGGGLYGLTRLVESPCVTTEAVWIGIAGAIWVVGILFAILGRVVSRERTNKDAFLSVQKIQAVETLLLRNPDAEELGHTPLDIMNDRHLDMAPRAARLRRLADAKTCCTTRRISRSPSVSSSRFRRPSAASW